MITKSTKTSPSSIVKEEKGLIQTSSTIFEKTLSSLIDKTNLDFRLESIGSISSFGDGVAKINGIGDAQSGELIDLGNGVFGLALNLEKNYLGVVVLGDVTKLNAGNKVKKTGRLLSVGVSDNILGRVIDGLGKPIDGQKKIVPEKFMFLERIAPGVITRQSVSVPLQTGIKSIDTMIPIGRGQRELIIGDRSTGKTSIALGTIINQHDQNVICVYVCVGQKKSSLAQIIKILQDRKAIDYTAVVAATASNTAAEQFLAPFTGLAVAEYFLEKGKDVLVVYDDLTKHAQAYREISLLLRRPSGREAYPGDVFYLHSRLLERACRLNKDYGGGSITALPIVETQANDVTAYIPTNVISITDGQIYLETGLFNRGMRPAINVGLSVSRVGSSAQIKAMKQVAGTMKLDLAQCRELEAFSQFSSDLDVKTRTQLDRGVRINAILKQGWDQLLKVEEQVVVVFAAVNGYLDKVREESLKNWEAKYLEYMHNSHQDLLDNIAEEKILDDSLIGRLVEYINDFNNSNEEMMIIIEENEELEEKSETNR